VCAVELGAGIDPISVEVAAVPRRPVGVRLSRLKTLPESVVLPPAPRVRRRVLAPADCAEGEDYELRGVLGEGGMGVVWSARQRGMNREVALKRVRPGSGPRAISALLAEAEMTGSLEHPGIIPVHEVGIDQDGMPFYSMRRLNGRTWAERWEGMRQREHLDVLVRVCDAVSFAHGRGVIHRDLKPDNVFLGEYGEIIVFDWGLAVRLADLRTGSRSQMASGTPVYMAPEMACADLPRLGPASDVYLLGAILYEILTGTAPHPGEETEEVLFAAAENRIDPPIPEGDLGDVVRRAMATKPADRFPTVRAFQAALRVCLEHQESITLAERARARLEAARSGAGYDGFARAVHTFEDAIELWPENRMAVAGLSQARLAYAARARVAGDLDLAADLLRGGDPAHAEESTRVTALVASRLRRRRAQRVLTWTSAGLLAGLIAALLVGYLAVRQQRDQILSVTRERDIAEMALLRQQEAEETGNRRLWKRLVQEDFSSGSMPRAAKVLSGRWGVGNETLGAEGDLPAVLAVPLASAKAVVTQFDLEPGGNLLVRIGSDAAADLEVALDDRLVVRRGGTPLAESGMGQAPAGLARRLRIEIRQEQLQIRVDGRVAVAALPVAGLSLDSLRLVADPGTVLDNLKVEVPWE
jgi:predicted Ser/Thr protein kinase